MMNANVRTMTVNASEMVCWDETPEASIELLKQIPGRHSNKSGGIDSPSLYDIIGFDQLNAQLQEAESSGDPSEYDTQRIAVANHISRCVNGALWFPDEGKDPVDRRVPPSMADVARNQTADCYGLTALASSCLELAGQEHWIGWGNGHSFIVLPIGRGDETSLYFLDPLSPRLSRKLDGMVPRLDPLNMPEQLAEHGRAVFRLRTDNFCDPARPYDDFSTLARRHPWMKLGHRPNVHESFLREARTSLFVSVFLPRDGREALDAHNRLIRATATGNTESATQAAMDLYGRYPELDARNEEDYKRIRNHIQQLCAEGEFATALNVTEAYFTSFGLTDDTRIALRQEQCLRTIADSTRRTLGRIALSAEQDMPQQSASQLDNVGRRAMHAARQSLVEAQQRYSRADRHLRPRHAQEVIAGRLASLTEA